MQYLCRKYKIHIHIDAEMLLFILSTWASMWRQGSNRIQSLTAKGTLKH